MIRPVRDGLLAIGAICRLRVNRCWRAPTESTNTKRLSVGIRENTQVLMSFRDRDYRRSSRLGGLGLRK